jgi:hypothetical protein
MLGRTRSGCTGVSGDGHLGRLNLSHAYYFAFGYDERNEIAGQRLTSDQKHGGGGASVDRDYLRFKGSFFWAQE